MLFNQPVGLEQMLEHALSLTEYKTFSKVMRAKAQEMAARRAWEQKAEERRQRSNAIRERLSSPSAEDLRESWVELRQRTLALVLRPTGADGDEEDALPADLGALLRSEDEKFAELSAIETPPPDGEKKRELFQLLASPFLRVLGFLPTAASALNEKLPKLKEVIDAGQQPCSAICAQALLQCHRLLDDAEAKTDEGIAKQNAAAAEARATFEAKAAQTARVEALEGAE